MAQFQDERTISEKSSDPLKLQHGEREESQQQQPQQAWPKPSAPAFHTKQTQVADDQRHDEHEDDVPSPRRKSVLRRVKDRAKTLIQKHGYGHGHDHKEEEDHHQFEEEEGDDHLEQQEKEDTKGEKKEKAEDLNSNFSSRSLDTGSAVSPGLDASSTRSLSNDAKAARDREVTNTGIQWTPRDPDVVAEGSEPRAASDRRPSPVEIARGQQELPTSPGQVSAGVTPTLQSTEATSTPPPPPEDDVQGDSHSDRYMAHQAQDLGTFDTADLATHPVQSEFSQELPNSIPYNRRKEAPENELYGKDESEKIEYSDPFVRSPRDPEGMMKSITEETAGETVPIQPAAEDRWFNADNVVAGAPTVKDQNPSPSHLGSEKFGTTEPISDEIEYADQDKLGDKEIKRHAGVSDESPELGTQQEASSEKFNENVGRSAALESATSVEGSKDTATMDLGGTKLHDSEKEKESKYEEGIGDDESHMEKINGMTATENSANVATKRGNDGHQSMDEAPYEPNRMAEEDNYENSEEGKSYGDKIYDIDSTEKNEISSKPGYGEHQEPEQEETEKRTERPSADDEEGAHEEIGKSLTDTPSAAESVTSSNPAVEEKAERQTIERYEDDVDEKTRSDGKSLTDTPSAAERVVSSNPAVEEKAEGKTMEMYEDDVDEKAKSDGKSLTDTPSAAESVVSSNPVVEEKAEGQTKSDGDDTVAGKSYTDKIYSTAGTAKSAFYSAFGYGGAKTVQDKGVQPTDRNG